MIALSVDSSVVLAAHGGPSQQRAECRDFLTVAHQQGASLYASVELVQEVLFHRMRRGSRHDALQLASALTSSLTLAPFDESLLKLVLRLVEDTAIRGRDAVHAAAALAVGVPQFVTIDTDFAAVEELAVLSPKQALAVLRSEP